MSNAQDQEIARLCKELAFNKGIRLTPTNEWLVSCVNCYREEVKSPGQYTLSDLFQFVYEQWLLADLKEIASPTFPAASIATAPYISGRFAVQMNYALNVAVSCHKQYQKLCRPEAGNNLEVDGEGNREKEPTAVRALKLELTDGITTVIAFEDKPIKCLKDPMPGEKLLLKGKILVHKSILMLNDGNVEYLGGEVDTLLVPNATENVLARKLGLPENPRPYGDAFGSDRPELPNGIDLGEDPSENDYDEAELLRHMELLESQLENRQFSASPLTTSSNSMATSSSLTNTRPSATTSSNHRPSATTSSSNPQPLATTSRSNPHPSSATSSHRSSASVDNSSTPRPSISSSSILKPQTYSSIVIPKSTASLSQPSQPVENSFEFADDFDDIDPETINSVLHKFESPHEITKNQVNSTASRNKFSQFDDDDDVIFTGTHVYDYFKVPGSSASEFTQASHLIKEPTKNESSLSNQSLKTELQEEWPPKKFPCERKVLAEVTGLTSKLKLIDAQFRLSGKINCQGHEFEVDFSPKFLDKAFCLTAAEVLAKKKVIKKDELLKQQVNEQLRRSHEQILALKGKMVIKFESVSDKPIVVDIESND